MIPPRFWEGPDATLIDVLNRREQRAAQQRQLLTQGSTLVSFTMNIPGSRKSFPLAHAGFTQGVAALESAFSGQILHTETYSGVTGEEAFFLLRLPASEAKSRAVRLEETHPLGRLWDMDVLDETGLSLSRSALGHPQRTCLICGKSAKECGRSRRHSAQELFFAAAQVLYDVVLTQAAQAVGRQALAAMMGEVAITPKPGLVDRHDSGSHTDMDFFTFLDSAAALSPWPAQWFRTGWDTQGPAPLFAALKAQGIQAEQEMFAATGGINTHKGLIFSLSILCGALGQAASAAFPQRPTWDTIRRRAAQIAAASLHDLTAQATDTPGLRAYRAHALPGIRGEAAAGFPSVFDVGLPALRHWILRGCSRNDAAGAALLALISQVDDTNMLHRGGYAQAQRRKAQAAELLAQATPETLPTLLSQLNEEYIAANLSPGGCADLLALTLFVSALQQPLP